MDPSELLGMHCREENNAVFIHIYIMCVFSQNPRNRHSFHEVFLKFAIIRFV